MSTQTLVASIPAFVTAIWTLCIFDFEFDCLKMSKDRVKGLALLCLWLIASLAPVAAIVVINEALASGSVMLHIAFVAASTVVAIWWRTALFSRFLHILHGPSVGVRYMCGVAADNAGIIR